MTLGSSLVKPAGKKIVDILFDKLNKKFVELKNKSLSGDLSKEIRDSNFLLYSEKSEVQEKFSQRYLKFRTLVSPEKQVLVDEVYHPLKLHYVERGVRHKVDDKQVLFLDSGLVIVGKAGQGKTTTLRKIVYRELMKPKGFIPLIITLRTLNWENQDLDTPVVIHEEFENLGINLPEGTVKPLLGLRAFLICFDGFDEVPYEYRNLAIRLIQRTKNFYNSKCIITTRPNTEATYLSGAFEQSYLEDICNEDVVNIIKGNSLIDSEYRGILVEGYQNSLEIQKILITPILVDIFISVFGELTTTPKNEIDFYSELFLALASKHDKFKLMERPKKTNVDIKGLYQTFTRVCLQITAKYESQSLNETQLQNIFSEACESLLIEGHNNLCHEEVMDRTSLIIKDGNDYTFIHKTIVEFHAAVYISSLSEDKRKSFYSKLQDDFNPKYINVIKYLRDIDSICISRFFIQPLIERSRVLSHDYVFSKTLAINLGIPNCMKITEGDSGFLKLEWFEHKLDCSNGISQNKAFNTIISSLGIDLIEEGVIPPIIQKVKKLYNENNYEGLIESSLPRDTTSESKTSEDVEGVFHTEHFKVYTFKVSDVAGNWVFNPAFTKDDTYLKKLKELFSNINKVAAGNIARYDAMNCLDDII